MLIDRFTIGIRRILPQASSEGGKGSQASKRKGRRRRRCHLVDCCFDTSQYSKKRLRTSGGQNEPKHLYLRRKIRFLQWKRRKSGSGKRSPTARWTEKSRTRARRKRKRRWRRTADLCFFILSNAFVLPSQFILDPRSLFRGRWL